VALRRDRRLGPAQIAGILGVHPFTVHGYWSVTMSRGWPGR